MRMGIGREPHVPLAELRHAMERALRRKLERSDGRKAQSETLAETGAGGMREDHRVSHDDRHKCSRDAPGAKVSARKKATRTVKKRPRQECRGFSFLGQRG